MEQITLILLVIAAAVIGVFAGIFTQKKRNDAENQKLNKTAEDIISKAKRESDEIVKEAKIESKDIIFKGNRNLTERSVKKGTT